LFRKKEQELISPVSNRLYSLEERISMLELNTDARLKEQQQNMLMQESTIEYVIKALQ
jgi:hypothetical protein